MTFTLPKRVLVLSAFTILVLVGIVAARRVIREFVLRPQVESLSPNAGEVGVEPNTAIKVTFTKAMLPMTIQPATLALRDARGAPVPATVTYDAATRMAILMPMSPLEQDTAYEVTLKGGRDGVLDRRKRPLAQGSVWNFTTGIKAAGGVAEGPGGPILLITSKANGFSSYYAEILRSEGFNEFAVKELSQVSAEDLKSYDVVLIGAIPVENGSIRMLTEWVKDGGNLIAMRPGKKLAEALGWNVETTDPDGSVQHSGYLAIAARSAAGTGLLHQPIQFHTDADRLREDKATVLATLYKDDKVATQYPAVSAMKLGSGNVVVFSYDLARSVVTTRQGNPEWSGVERDGIPPVRSDDLFYGASEKDPQPDRVDPNLIAVPQADIQQRLLANVITMINAERMPLPRFWYLPRGLKAVIVMTGDDHGHGGTVGRFATYQKRSKPGCSVESWECIRATSNIFIGSISSEEAAEFTKLGFEIGLHVYTACTDWPTRVVRDNDGHERKQVIREDADALYTQQLKGFANTYPGVPSPVSSRTDCITWGDYDTQPQVELSHDIRLDTNYYYWPGKWVKNRPGLFTGSGMPMRFARIDGTPIDVYQATTQMTDESDQLYPETVDALLAKALGAEEFFGIFTANMHTDKPKSPGSDAILNSAEKHHVPVISAAQLLEWLDGRNASAFRNLKWSGNELSFEIEVGAGANGLEAMLPLRAAQGEITSIAHDGKPVPWQKRTVAGMAYAVIAGAPGVFQAKYGR